MKRELKIFVFGGARAMAVHVNLRRRYKTVRYFRNKSECDFKQDDLPDIVILDEDLSNHDRFESLRSMRQSGNFHIIYMSRNKRFTSIIKAFNLGATDYIVKDSYLYYAINNSVYQLLKLRLDSNEFISNYEVREISSTKMLYPRGFKLYQWFAYFQGRLRQ